MERPIVVLVHAPWCHFCEALRPAWDELASRLSNAGMQVLEIELEMMPELRRAQPDLADDLERGGTDRIVSVPHVAFRSRAGENSVRYDDSILPSDYELPVQVAPRSTMHMMSFVKDRLEDNAKFHHRDSDSASTDPRDGALGRSSDRGRHAPAPAAGRRPAGRQRGSPLRRARKPGSATASPASHVQRVKNPKKSGSKKPRA